MKIAIVQFNPTVGALEDNCRRMVDFYHDADKQGADLVVFPEMAVCGYPIEDLASSEHFVAATERAVLVSLLSQIEGEAAILFGTVTSNGPGKRPSNSAIFFHPRTMQQETINKYELPNYGVFDEKRIFEPQDLDLIKPVMFKDRKLGIMICEDMWQPTVTAKLAEEGANVLIALNGSPFEAKKNEVRIEQARRRIEENFARNRGIDFIYVNMVGGQDELVFDGGSFVLGKYEHLVQLPFFTEDMHLIGLGIPGRHGDAKAQPEPIATYQACVLGLRDYCRKGHFRSVAIGMSGGVDSALVAAIAVDALGPDKVHLVRLPSGYSSEGSLTDAAKANERLGTNMRTINIEPVVKALREAYTEAVWDTPNAESVAADRLMGVADENIQARARGNILMAISNQEGHLLLTTGNKSEVSVGYATLYGDMAGGFNPIKDVYKTTVFEMCRRRNMMTEENLRSFGFHGPFGDVVPGEIIDKPPSAELAPGQRDQDSLPPYLVLDAILKAMIEKQLGVREVIKLGYADETTVRHIRYLIDRAEYKRRQAAPGIKTGSKMHGRDRRVPIINSYSG